MAHEWEAIAHDPEIRPLLYREVEGREVARTYLRHAERQTEQQEIEATDRKLTDPVERRFLQNPGKLAQQNAQRKKNLLAQSPPTDLSLMQRDKLHRLERVLTDSIRDGMPTTEAMRHNSPGVVDHHMAWDRVNKPRMLAWKNVRLLLNPQSDAVDLANFERYRPSNAAGRDLYANAQIPGQWALSPQAKQQYDQIDWSDPTAFAKEAERRGYVLVERGTPAQGREKPVAVKAPGRVTATCEQCGIQYRGGFGPKNLQRHQAQAHGVREEVPA